MIEKSLGTQRNELDAAACDIILTHVLLGASQEIPNAEEDVNEMSCLGCSQIQVVRNYTGEDDDAGSLIIVSSDLAGKIRVWELPEDMDNELSPNDGCVDNPSSPKIAQEFCVDNATGIGRLPVRLKTNGLD